ncbi:hypothetical protein F4604DRAFT_1595819, partial [Suillus subluteus]
LSNFKLWPLPECKSFASCNTSMSVRKTLLEGSPDDAGSPRYFRDESLQVELTASRRTALHRYTFPPSSCEPRIVVDITNDSLTSNTEPVINVNTATGRITGGARFASSFGPGRYNVYTCVDFKGDGYNFKAPTEYGVWMENAPVQNSTQLTQLYSGFLSEMGALLTFPPSPNPVHTTILARVGVSFISSDQACANAESEIPNFDFDVPKTWIRLLHFMRP